MDANPSPPQEIYQDFLERYPDYPRTQIVDDLRRRDFSRLKRSGEVYLDYTGSGLYPESLVRRHAGWLESTLLGNPHSENPASRASTEGVERCRSKILDFFRADPAEYALVFTSNASHALKLVGEAYPFQTGDRFLLTFDNHNSVNGIREFDRVRGARTLYLPIGTQDLRVHDEDLAQYLAQARPDGHNLFAFPAQSNFSGVRHPLEWIPQAQAMGWDVLLDAAAFVPTAFLDLSRWHPDFVCLSFYKMFGYPTGVGALLARRQALRKLHRPWFAGGTITLASVQADCHLPASAPACFEDGTLNFLSIPAVESGLDLLEEVGYDTLGLRTRLLTSWLLEELLALRHANGARLIRLYGPEDMEGRGATLALNFQDPHGQQVDHRDVELRAAARKISLRTGCFCNPGAGELALGISAARMHACIDESVQAPGCQDARRCLDPRGAGAVRISLGLASNFADVHACLELARDFLDS